MFACLGAQAVRETQDPTTRGPHCPPGTLLACRAAMLTPVSWDRHGDSSFQGPPAWRICAIGPLWAMLIKRLYTGGVSCVTALYEIKVLHPRILNYLQ